MGISEEQKQAFLDDRAGVIIGKQVADRFAIPVVQAWQASPLATRRRDPELLVNADGTLRTAEMRQLFDRRDNRRLFLRE